MEFAGNHQILVSAFIIISGLLAWNLIADPGGKNAMGPTEATSLINHQDAVIIDVRTPAEFKGGHIVNAENIPLAELNGKIDKLGKYKGSNILMVCRSGSRSGMATRTLLKAGFENTHNLRGGMLAWENASLPVTRRT
ncbi:MAG: rhodanese-like domain-containing protein [bacterium]